MSNPIQLNIENKIQTNEKKINHVFDHIRKENKEYEDTLTAAVEYVKRTQPLKYLKAQNMGNSLMNVTYDGLIPGQDNEGDLIRAKTIKNTAINYDFNDDELTPEELALVIKVYGKEWRNN